MDPNNWDLQAVVRSCSFNGKTTASTADAFYSVPSPPLLNEEQLSGEEVLLMRFPEPSELEDLCKPFILRTLHQPPPPPQQQQQQQRRRLHLLSSTAPHQPQSQIHRSKRRKNQQKKVVCQVPTEGVSSDMWAWRKYGQKPIKGSPYPRGYYRCSSSKGCPARKQVERSLTDPGMLVITYTAEHNHPLPTHRNSLAGSTRHKFPPPPSSSAPGGGAGDGDGERLLSQSNPSSSPLSTSDAAGLSPITPLTASMEEELLHGWRRRPGKGEEGGVEEEDEDGELLTVGDMEMVGDGEMLFMELEEICGGTTVSATSPAAATSVARDFLVDGGDGFAEHFFPPSIPSDKYVATAAGGR